MKDFSNSFRCTTHTAPAAFFLFFAVMFFVALPPKANAQIVVPVGDFTLQATAASNLTVNTELSLKETVLDAAAYGAATAAVEVISNQIANTILSQYNAIVRSFNQEIRELINRVEDGLGIDLQLASTCFPSQLPLYRNTQWNKFKFRASISCSLTQVAGVNPVEFENDFNKGGLLAFKETALRPQNNAFGQYILAQKELQRRKEEAVKEEEKTLDWGRGVRPIRDRVTGFIKVPAATIQEQLNTAFGLTPQRVAQADEVSEVVASFTALLVSNALQDGVF